MTAIAELSDAALAALAARARADYDAFRARGLKLDMTRGKPALDQLSLSDAMASLPGNGDHFSEGGEDARNYGNLQGLAEMRAFFAPILGAPAAQVAIGENSSLSLMHDCVARACRVGVPGGARPWAEDPDRAFLCLTPGYDRHFGITEEYGFRLIPVPLTGEGPDMARVEAAVADPAVKGMWCVPRYSNPSGETYSDDVVRGLAAMRAAAPDFRLFWDDAYAVHRLTGARAPLANVLDLCAGHGNPDRAIVFASTSKVTLAGAGVAALASSPANVAWFLAGNGVRTIGPDKLNQLRHLRFLRDMDGLDAHMERHRSLIAPKFEAVQRALAARLDGTGAARWTRPEGGYFVSLDAVPGTAARVVALARAAGVALTPAGATWPHGHDPEDRNLRLAPTFPTLAEVGAASEGIAICVLLAAVEALEAGRGAARQGANAAT